MSADGGKTWGKARTIESGFSGYSDLAAAPDGGVYLFYERGSTDGANVYKTGRLTFTHVPAAGL